MKINIKRISGYAPHSAFTDLCAWNGHLYCCFREAKNHVSKDGHIRILTLNSNGTLIYKTIIHIQQTDLRDPKLTVHPNGKLCLLVWKKQFDSLGNYIGASTCRFFSSDGQSWSSPKEIGDNGWWLWRARWHKRLQPTSKQLCHEAFGFAYNRGANAIHLYRGNLLSSMQLEQSDVLSLKTHRLGYPNESDMIFDGDTAWAIVRRDADSFSAQLGCSKWPFKQWRWQDLKLYLGGPCMLQKNKNTAWVCARIWEDQKLSTRLMELNLNTQTLKTVADLPSAGDNSYPGLAKIDTQLFISYYSSHEDGKSQIYLAKFDDV